MLWWPSLLSVLWSGPFQVTEALGRPQTLHLSTMVSPVSHVTSLNGIINSGGTGRRILIALGQLKFINLLFYFTLSSIRQSMLYLQFPGFIYPSALGACPHLGHLLGLCRANTFSLHELGHDTTEMLRITLKFTTVNQTFWVKSAE